MDEPREYQQRRLDLADMLRTVMHLARAYDDAERKRGARALLTRLTTGRLARRSWVISAGTRPR